MGHQSLTSGMELRHNILVSGNADSTVKVWDIVSGHCLQTLSGPNKHQSAVTCLQFNSHFVITSSDDGTVKLWDVKTGEFHLKMITIFQIIQRCHFALKRVVASQGKYSEIS